MALSLMPLPKQHYSGIAGLPLVGGKVYTYAAGTVTPKQTFSDAAGTIPQTNPIILNARGEPASAIYWSGNYKVEVRDALDNLIYTVDNYNTDPLGFAGLSDAADPTKGDALIAVKRTTANAVATTQHQVNEYREFLPVADFAAIGDGVADDSAAIQKAASSGSGVDLGGKTYLCTSKILFSTADTIFRNGTLKFNGPNTSRLADVTANNVTFQNVAFDGNLKQPRFAMIYVDTNVVRPRFFECTFRNLLGNTYGSNTLNQMYALNINPYAVADFEIKDCLFQNIRKYNDGSIVPAAVGLGFVGGVVFLPEDGGDPAAAQPTPTRGQIAGCTFNIVQTILAGGLTDNDVALFDDGDAIRTYMGSGAKRLNVSISDCQFIACSKRAVKLRASGGSFTDSQIYGDLLPYGMVSPIDTANNCSVSNIKIFTSSTKPCLKVATYNITGDAVNYESTLRDIFATHCKTGVELTPVAGTDTLENVVLDGLDFPNCSALGVVRSGVAPARSRNLRLSNVAIVADGNNCQGLLLNAATDSSNGWTLSNVTLTNADAVIDGANNVVDLTVNVINDTFAGSSAGAELVKLFSTGAGGFNQIDKLVLNCPGIANAYINGTRTRLALIRSDNLDANNINIVVPDTLATSGQHMVIFGNDTHVDGLSYTGTGTLSIGELGNSQRFSMKNAIRKGGGACTLPFFSLSNSNSAFYEFINLTDFRPTTATSIIAAGATNGIAGNIQTRSSNGTPAASGVAKTFNLNTF